MLRSVNIIDNVGTVNNYVGLHQVRLDFTQSLAQKYCAKHLFRFKYQENSLC